MVEGLPEAALQVFLVSLCAIRKEGGLRWDQQSCPKQCARRSALLVSSDLRERYRASANEETFSCPLRLDDVDKDVDDDFDDDDAGQQRPLVVGVRGTSR